MRYYQLLEYNKPDLIARASESFLKRFKAESGAAHARIAVGGWRGDNNPLELALADLDQHLQQYVNK